MSGSRVLPIGPRLVALGPQTLPQQNENKLHGNGGADAGQCIKKGLKQNSHQFLVSPNETWIYLSQCTRQHLVQFLYIAVFLKGQNTSRVLS